MPVNKDRIVNYKKYLVIVLQMDSIKFLLKSKA